MHSAHCLCSFKFWLRFQLSLPFSSLSLLISWYTLNTSPNPLLPSQPAKMKVEIWKPRYSLFTILKASGFLAYLPLSPFLPSSPHAPSAKTPPQPGLTYYDNEIHVFCYSRIPCKFLFKNGFSVKSLEWGRHWLGNGFGESQEISTTTLTSPKEFKIFRK